MTILRRNAVAMFLFVFLFAATLGHAQGFLFEIQPLAEDAIKTLSDEKLMDTYIDVMVELEAVDTFYDTAGLTPKEYKKYKALLRFRTDLLLEIQKRELKIPQIK